LLLLPAPSRLRNREQEYNKQSYTFDVDSLSHFYERKNTFIFPNTQKKMPLFKKRANKIKILLLFEKKTLI